MTKEYKIYSVIQKWFYGIENSIIGLISSPLAKTPIQVNSIYHIKTDIVVLRNIFEINVSFYWVLSRTPINTYTQSSATSPTPIILGAWSKVA